jgi:glycosyltransferase involved in cell wall biosynthesis
LTPQKNKVLIITYYWPPSGGSGVQRWLKFVKYLPQLGWEPHVFTPENPSFAIKDESLLKDVPDEAEIIRFPIWEPYDLFFNFARLFGKSRTHRPTDLATGPNKTFFQRVTSWIRGNFFIPDPRVFWVRPSFDFLNEYLNENNIRTVITTGPPHSLHLIGYRLKKKNPGIRWLADFRDPWSQWGLLDSLGVGKWARKRHRKFESDVLRTADDVITITPFYRRQFEALSNRKVHLLTNGYDADDFKNLSITKSSKFIIRHVGIINEKCDPRPFMKALEEAIADSTDFHANVEMEFVGEVHARVREYADRSENLKRITVFSGNIPHKELIKLYGSSSLLVLILTGYKDAEGYMPGKLFEYLATGLPILGIGPVNGDAAQVLKESQAGTFIDSDNIPDIKNELLKHFKAWQAGTRQLSSGQVKYSRQAITQQLSELLLR